MGYKVDLTVQPRVQKEKWSLYWRESMATRTEALDPIQFKVDSSTKVKEVRSKLAADLQWEPVGSLLRLQGFEHPWERTVFQGKEMDTDATLEECGVPAQATVTAVRTVLVAEGWAIARGDDVDSDTDEEDF